MIEAGLRVVPLVLIFLVLGSTFARAVSVRRESGVDAIAIVEATGMHRLAGIIFSLSGAVITAAAAAIALGLIEPHPVLFAVGTILATIGALVVIVAQQQMGIAWRVGVRDGDAPQLVNSGLFRYSRNPIFAGMIAMAVGIALAAGSWWMLVPLAAFIWSSDRQVRIEEAHLMRAFSRSYEAYAQSTPRWMF